MIKLPLCIVILFCGAVSGLHLSAGLKKRLEVLRGFEVMLQRALMQIEYNAGDLCEAFSENFAGFVFCRDEPFDEQWILLVNKYSSSLKREDVSLLIELIKGLGTTDSHSQHRHIMMYAQLLQERIEKAKEDIRIKSKMYRIIPLSAGIMISLLLI